MQAILAREFGGPEVLKLEDVPEPAAGAGQVRVKIHAVGVNPYDTYMRAGGYAIKPDLPYTPGADAAGVVDQVGSGVTSVASGQRVYISGTTLGKAHGAYAQYALCTPEQVHRLPDRISFTQGAGLFVPYVTAWRALFGRANTRAGDTVLIHGASGGVGLMAVQLAVGRGATVIATASPTRHEQLSGYGATPVEYGPGLADRVRAIGPVDAALDLVGSDEALDTSVELVADRNRIATIVGFARAGELGIAALSGADGGQAVRNEARPELIRLAAAGKLTVTVDRAFPLDEAAEAHRYLQTGHARGKVVLVP